MQGKQTHHHKVLPGAEAGYSTASLNHPELQRLLNNARKGNFDVILVHKIGSPDWTMLITNPSCFENHIEWLLTESY